MNAFLRRLLMHYGIYRRYPLGRLPALQKCVAHRPPLTRTKTRTIGRSFSRLQRTITPGRTGRAHRRGRPRGFPARDHSMAVLQQPNAFCARHRQATDKMAGVRWPGEPAASGRRWSGTASAGSASTLRRFGARDLYCGSFTCGSITCGSLRLIARVAHGFEAQS
jgi:hypothetical protein